MTRVIKFRGRSTYDGRWVYGLLRVRDGLDHAIIEESNGAGHDIDIKTVGQLTGLLDKNGKEVFEGDIIHFTDDYHSKKFNREVIFVDGSFRYTSQQNKCYSLSRIVGQSFQVIGNIYQNPELLKENSK